MSEHKSEKQKLQDFFREAFKVTEADMEYAKAIMEEYKLSEDEAICRVQMCKKFAITHAKSIRGGTLKEIIDLIASGEIVPNTGCTYDYPMSAFLFKFEHGAKGFEKDGKFGGCMDVTVNFFGSDYVVKIMRKKDHDKALAAAKGK